MNNLTLFLSGNVGIFYIGILLILTSMIFTLFLYSYTIAYKSFSDSNPVCLLFALKINVKMLEFPMGSEFHFLFTIKCVKKYCTPE